MKQARCKFGSTCSLTVSNEVEDEVIDNIEFFKKHVILRPSEISNNPEVIRRLGVISMNTALEADIFGNINSTHVTGTRMMNGIGGSGDFTRNAYISIFFLPPLLPRKARFQTSCLWYRTLTTRNTPWTSS